MDWELKIDKIVRKQLKRIPKKERERLFRVVQELVINPYDGDIEKMEGEKDVWRRRIGSYRIKYELNIAQKFIHVFEIVRRTSNAY